MVWRSAWRAVRPRSTRASTGISNDAARCSIASCRRIAMSDWRGSGVSSGKCSGTQARNTGTSVASSARARRSAASSARWERAWATNGNRIRRDPPPGAGTGAETGRRRGASFSATAASASTARISTAIRAIISPVLGIISNLGLSAAVTHILRYYVGILAATILFIATNAGLIGISRLSWSLAEPGQLPGIFARLHRRHRTPWFTILIFSVFAGALVVPGQTAFLGNLYSFGAMLSFTTAHASVIALRFKEPDRDRPYRMPWNIRVPGRQRPISAYER